MSTTRPTSDQIAAEIEALETMKPHVRRWSAFKDDNHAAIDAQVRVLRERLGYTTIHRLLGESAFIGFDEDEDDLDGYGDMGDFSENNLQSALDAFNWMTGATTEPAPSVGWAELAPGALRPAAPRRLVSSDQAVRAKCQHTTPCSDCPWARTALNGWLGGESIDEWLQRAHSNTQVDCHTLTGVQCAGLAIYRANVIKRVEPPLLALPKDKAKVFETPMQFRAHHEARPGTRSAS